MTNTPNPLECPAQGETLKPLGCPFCGCGMAASSIHDGLAGEYPFERWPGYDLQNWHERFEELERQYDKLQQEFVDTFEKYAGCTCLTTAAVPAEPSGESLAEYERGREQGLKEAERVCRLYSEWCKNWGMDRNARVAQEAASEIADLLPRVPKILPEDDEEAAKVLWQLTDWWQKEMERQRAKESLLHPKGHGGEA